VKFQLLFKSILVGEKRLQFKVLWNVRKGHLGLGEQKAKMQLLFAFVSSGMQSADDGRKQLCGERKVARRFESDYRQL
jgi:hypothetical protein